MWGCKRASGQRSARGGKAPTGLEARSTESPASHREFRPTGSRSGPQPAVGRRADGAGTEGATICVDG
jgi:hypothetical protein